MSETEAERAALDLAALCGKLSAVVEWCINHDGETLGDNPHQLAYAKQALAQAQERRGDDRQVVEKIKARRYECFIEDHESKPWTPGQCAAYAGRNLHLMRCKRSWGYGIGGLFCRQHKDSQR